MENEYSSHIFDIISQNDFSQWMLEKTFFGKDKDFFNAKYLFSNSSNYL